MEMEMQQQSKMPQGEADQEDIAKIEYLNQIVNDQKFEDINNLELGDMIQALDVSEEEENNAYYKQQKQEDDVLPGVTIDLNKCLFTKIVELCWRQKLISQDIMHSFQTNYTASIAKRYIDLFNAGRLQHYDFQHCKINIIDHRRLTQMLIRKRPSRYLPLTKPENPYDFVKQIQEFLRQIYMWSSGNYESTLRAQVCIHYQTWWGGPQRLEPIVNPPVIFYQTEESRKRRQQHQKTIVVASQEEQKQRDKRINTHRATPTDLKSIAKQLGHKFFGKIQVHQDENIKMQIENKSSVGQNQVLGSRKEKHKKIKKDRQSNKGDKKEKKEKSHSKSKKNKKKKDRKKQKKDKKDHIDDDAKQEVMSTHSSKKAKKE